MSPLNLIQAVIALSAVLAVALTQSRLQRRRRWAPVVGLAGQPFWLVITCSWATWGMFASSLLYTAVWLYGLWNHWLRPQDPLEFGGHL